MTLLYADPLFLEHDTGPHPERAQRLRQVYQQIDETGLAGQCLRPQWTPASPATMALVHDPRYTMALEGYALQGGGRIEADTVVSTRSFEVARYAAGAVSDAVERVVGGQDSTALCLVRPPGHHALADAPMGFCLLNNVAIGARIATRQLGLSRALIVDWDVHHGNGTQATFWDDGQVALLSIHRWPFYPGTGDSDETGSGPGLGMIVNLPIVYGTSRHTYFTRLTTELTALADRVRPELVLVSAGFDSHRDDPIGSLGLESEDFSTLTRLARQVAAAHAGGRLVSVLEGGYNPPVLARCVEHHLRELLVAEPLPPETP